MNRLACERCHRVTGNVGPWRGHGWKLLCGGCKAYLALMAPRARAAFARSIEAAIPGASVEIEEPEDPARAARAARGELPR